MPWPLYPYERTTVLILFVAGWSLEPVSTFWRRDKSLASAGIRKRVRAARSTVAIPTTLTYLLLKYEALILIIVLQMVEME
jgi:hypothetical protein